MHDIKAEVGTVWGKKRINQREGRTEGEADGEAHELE